MNNIFKKITWQTLIPPVFFVLLGLILAIWPQSSIKVVCTVAALIMAVVGIICLYCYFSGREDLFSGRINLVCGVLMIAIAVWIITRSNYFLSLIPILAGITVLVHGLVDLRQAILLRQIRQKNWLFTLVIALLAVCLAFIMLINPFETLVTIMRFIGIVLAAVGISDIFVLTQGKGLVPHPGKSRKASLNLSSKRKNPKTGSRSSKKRQSDKAASSRRSPSSQEISPEEISQEASDDLPDNDWDAEESPTVQTSSKKSNGKSKKSGSLLGDKLKGLNKNQRKAEKASRMSKLERVLGNTSEETPDSIPQEDWDVPKAPQEDPEDFKISAHTAPSSGGYVPVDEDDEDDFWDDEEWDKL